MSALRPEDAAPGRRARRVRLPLAESALFDYAVKALARRMRTERELRRVMAVRAEPGAAGAAAIDAIIRRLVELRYLSDAQFAADYTRIRKEGGKLGPRRVQQDLAHKGIARELAGTAVSAAYENTDEVALARQYCARKRLQKPADEKAQARLLGRLLRAGFSPATVFRVLRDWGLQAEEFDVSLEPADDSSS